MMLTLSYIRKAIKKDSRFSSDAIDILDEGQVAVWLKPEFTWCANDGNRTVEHFSIEDGWNPQDTVEQFNSALKMIERAI